MVARDFDSAQRERDSLSREMHSISRAPRSDQAAMFAAFFPRMIGMSLSGRILAPEHSIRLRITMAALAGINSAVGAEQFAAADALADSRCQSVFTEVSELLDELSPVLDFLRSSARPGAATKLLDHIDSAIERAMQLGRFQSRDEFAGPRRAAKARAARQRKSRCAEERLLELAARKPNASAEEIGRLYRDEIGPGGGESLPDLALPTLARKVRELRRQQSQKRRTG